MKQRSMAEEPQSILLNNPPPITNLVNPSGFMDLKEYGRSRMLYDMLDRVKNRCKLSPEYVVLVVDDYAAKTLSNFCDVFDLMQNGNVYQIEKLYLQRKRYPQTDAIYFLRPSKKSIEQLIQDFTENQEFNFD